MGCVSSNLLNPEDDITRLGSSALSHHIVSLTSTTYGLLNLDPPPQNPSNLHSPATTPPPRFTLGSIFPTSLSLSDPKSLRPEPKSLRPDPDVINSWELMAGLDADSFRFSPIPKPHFPNKENSNPNFANLPNGSFSAAAKPSENRDIENSNPNFANRPKGFLSAAKPTKETDISSSGEPPLDRFEALCLPAGGNRVAAKPSENLENSNPNFTNRPNGSLPVAEPTKETVIFSSGEPPLGRFEALCPPAGGNRVVIYTTSLRGVRKTFEACNAVRAAIEGYGVAICERDVSMDRGFREELRGLMEGKEREAIVPPRVFVKGRYVGGAEEVLKMADEGVLGDLLHGLPKKRNGDVCGGCGGVRFLPCFHCNGSCKVVMNNDELGKKSVVLRCCECNENGLVICPICG